MEKETFVGHVRTLEGRVVVEPDWKSDLISPERVEKAFSEEGERRYEVFYQKDADELNFHPALRE